MAVLYMDRVNNYSDIYQSRDGVTYEKAETLSSPANGTPIILPPDTVNATFSLVVTAGSGSIQATTSSLADVVAGTANWYTHPSGTVTASYAGEFVPSVKAVRQVNASGTTKIEVTARCYKL